MHASFNVRFGENSHEHQRGTLADSAMGSGAQSWMDRCRRNEGRRSGRHRHGDAAAGRAASDDEQVEGRLLLQGVESVRSVHDVRSSNSFKMNVSICVNKQMF